MTVGFITVMPSVVVRHSRSIIYRLRAMEKRFPRAIKILDEGLEDSWAFYSFSELDTPKFYAVMAKQGN